jgi:hypothetical protein
MGNVYESKADLALDEWISRIDHGSDDSKAALEEVFRLFAEERHIKQWRRLTPSILVQRLAVYRLRRTRSNGAEWRFPPGAPRHQPRRVQTNLFDAAGVQEVHTPKSGVLALVEQLDGYLTSPEQIDLRDALLAALIPDGVTLPPA